MKWANAVCSLLVSHCKLQKPRAGCTTADGYLFFGSASKWVKGSKFHCVVPKQKICEGDLPSTKDLDEQTYKKQMYFIRQYGYKICGNRWISPAGLRDIPWVFAISKAPKEQANVEVNLKYIGYSGAYLAEITLIQDINTRRFRRNARRLET